MLHGDDDSRRAQNSVSQEISAFEHLGNVPSRDLGRFHLHHGIVHLRIEHLSGSWNLGHLLLA